MSNETKKPITEADVKVGARFKDGDDGTISTVCGLTNGVVTYEQNGERSRAELGHFVGLRNNCDACLITHGTGATDGLEARVAKVEGVLARICPEADSQTDGKGRTLVQIDAALEVSYRWHNAAHSAIQATQDKVDDHAARLDKLERLIAASVPVPAKVNVRSDAASTNEAMTEAAASDEGWREMLVPRKHHGSDDLVYWCTPHGDCEPCSASCPEDGWDWRRGGGTSTRVAFRGKITSEHLRIRAELPPPPNLAEWWKPWAKATKESGDDAAHRFAKELEAAREAVPPTYRVGDDLAAWVRNLASAHDSALKDMAQYRTQLAAAQTATVAAEGRAETARRHAADAEAKLAALRADIENVRASLGK